MSNPQLFQRPAGDSMSLNPPSAQREWGCEGLDDDVSVTAFALQGTLPIITHPSGILYRQDVRVTREGRELYGVSIPYGPRDPLSSRMRASADTTGGTFKIKVSRETRGKYTPGGKPQIDFGGAINKALDGTVEGADVVIPANRITVKLRHPRNFVTLNYSYALEDITGTVNSSNLLGRKAGEMLFMGASGDIDPDVECEWAYHFVASRNLQNLITGGITVASKDGHDLAWVYFEPGVAGGKAVSLPRQINIERVYDRKNLALLLGLPA